MLLNACAEKMRRFVAHKDNHRLYGLSVGQIEILRFLAEAEGDIMLKDLIKTFKISKSLASQSVARLYMQIPLNLRFQKHHSFQNKKIRAS